MGWECLSSAFSAPAVLAFSEDTRNEKYKVEDEMNTSDFHVSTSIPGFLHHGGRGNRHLGRVWSKAGVGTGFLVC